MNILEYEFMQRAFIVGILLSVAIPSIGIYIVIKRLSMIGDALSHTSLAGVATGLILGINPVLGAVSITVLAALSIEYIRKRIPRFSELSIAIIMSTGIGLAGVLSGFVKNSVNFNSFLFGSIVAISDSELYSVSFVTALILGVLLIFRKGIFYILMDEQGARLSGVPVNLINFTITVLTALTVSVASRTVGALIVSSMMVIPVVCAMQVGKSFRSSLLFAIFFSTLSTVSGIIISYYARLKPGGTIVLVGIFILILLLLFNSTKKWLQHLPTSTEKKR